MIWQARVCKKFHTSSIAILIDLEPYTLEGENAQHPSVSQTPQQFTLSALWTLQKLYASTPLPGIREFATQTLVDYS
jgi:hypothetical protein